MKIVNRMIEEDRVEAVVLGCTELPLILKETDYEVPLFNTVQIHVQGIIAEIMK